MLTPSHCQISKCQLTWHPYQYLMLYDSLKSSNDILLVTVISGDTKSSLDKLTSALSTSTSDSADTLVRWCQPSFIYTTYLGPFSRFPGTIRLLSAISMSKVKESGIKSMVISIFHFLWFHNVYTENFANRTFYEVSFPPLSNRSWILYYAQPHNILYVKITPVTHDKSIFM